VSKRLKAVGGFADYDGRNRHSSGSWAIKAYAEFCMIRTSRYNAHRPGDRATSRTLRVNRLVRPEVAGSG
jgi:hypothetical protein